MIELYDAILSGNNAEISVRSTLQRAAGFIPYNTNTVSGIPQKFAHFQPTSQSGIIYPIVDTTTNTFYLPPGSTPPTTLTTKASGVQTSFFGVGPYLYMGNVDFMQKWDTGSPQGVTKWGIAPTAFTSSVAAYAGLGADNNSGNSAWSNPTNIQGAPDGAVAVTSLTVPANHPSAFNSNVLDATTYGFAIAAANTMTGVQLDLTGFASLFFSINALANLNAVLLINGVPTGTPKGVPLTSANSTQTVGGAGDTWGISNLTGALINATSFGVRFYLSGFNRTGAPHTFSASLDAAHLTIFNSGAPAVALVAGTLTATQGFQYLACYGNSNDTNIGNPTPASASIKPVAQGVQISLVASTDPQVNQIRVFRTTDTGTGALFFELPTSPYPNTTQNVTDNAVDSTLQLTQSVTVGSVAFSPPPPGLVNLEWYAGRMWGSVGNLLYFSAGPDNAPMGNGNSDWPPGNVFPLPTQIVKNCALNGGNGMLVTTVDGIHVVQGITNPGFTVNKWLSDVGARTQNAVDTDGSTIYMFTSDRQYISISANGVNELSQPVSDQTDNLDPTAVYVAAHRSGSQDSRVFLTDGSTGYYPYNLMFGAWEPKRTIASSGAAGAIGSIEIQAGIYKLLMGSTQPNQLILQRDLSTFSDNAATYPWNAIFGSIPLADPTQLANVESIVLRYRNNGSVAALSALPNDTAGTFINVPSGPFEPPEASQAPVGFAATKYYLNQASNLWTQMSHIQLQVAFPAEANQDELLSFGIFPNESTDQPTTALPAVQGR